MAEDLTAVVRQYCVVCHNDQALTGNLTLQSFDFVRSAEPAVEILLLGSGPKMGLLPSKLRRELRDAGIVVDVMETGAACRTYNVLLSEDRRVAAALLPV